MCQLRGSHFFPFQSFCFLWRCILRSNSVLILPNVTRRPRSVQPNCWSFLVLSNSLSSIYWLWFLSVRSAGFPSSCLVLDRSSPVSMRTEETVEEEAEASIGAAVLVSTRLLLTVLKVQEKAKVGINMNMLTIRLINNIITKITTNIFYSHARGCWWWCSVSKPNICVLFSHYKAVIQTTGKEKKKKPWHDDVQDEKTEDHQSYYISSWGGTMNVCAKLHGNSTNSSHKQREGEEEKE